MNDLIVEFNSQPSVLTKKIIKNGVTNLKQKKNVLIINISIDIDLLKTLSDDEIKDKIYNCIKIKENNEEL